MTPVEATARTGAAPSGPRRPALRAAAPAATRRARVADTLRQGNLIGRIFALTVGALFLGVFGVIVFQALLVQGQAHLDRLNAEVAAQQAAAKQLHLQVAQLDSPGRIVTYAQSQLHMVDPGNVVYLQQGPGDDAKAATAVPATTAAPTTTVKPKRPAPTTSAPETSAPTTTAPSRRP